MHIYLPRSRVVGYLIASLMTKRHRVSRGIIIIAHGIITAVVVVVVGLREKSTVATAATVGI